MPVLALPVAALPVLALRGASRGLSGRSGMRDGIEDRVLVAEYAQRAVSARGHGRAAGRCHRAGWMAPAPAARSGTSGQQPGHDCP